MDEGDRVVEEGKRQRTQWHAVGPVATLRTLVVKEVGIPSWDGCGEEGDGYHAGEKTGDVQYRSEAAARTTGSTDIG